MQQLAAIPDSLIHKSLRIEFTGEQEIDGGGLIREWAHLFCMEIFKQERGMFVTTQSNDLAHWINPKSREIGKNHLEVIFLEE